MKKLLAVLTAVVLLLATVSALAEITTSTDLVTEVTFEYKEVTIPSTRMTFSIPKEMVKVNNDRTKASFRSSDMTIHFSVAAYPLETISEICAGFVEKGAAISSEDVLINEVPYVLYWQTEAQLIAYTAINNSSILCISMVFSHNCTEELQQTTLEILGSVTIQ